MNIRKIASSRAHRRSAGAFTLIEILLVIVIILMLAAALVVFVLPQQEGAEKNTTRLMLSQVETALDTYRLNIGRYPSEEEGGLGALLVKPNYENERQGEKWAGPYLKPGTKLEDPWGHKLIYELIDRNVAENKSGPAYKLFSIGPDGQPETDDDIRATAEGESNQESTSVLDK
jgi:general secretion pathway protein G